MCACEATANLGFGHVVPIRAESQIAWVIVGAKIIEVSNKDPSWRFAVAPRIDDAMRQTGATGESYGLIATTIEVLSTTWLASCAMAATAGVFGGPDAALAIDRDPRRDVGLGQSFPGPTATY